MGRTVTGWLHQMDQQPAGDVAGQVADLGVSRLAVKCLDGASWMSGFDRGPGAMGSVADLVSLESRLGAFGVGLDAWVNVTAADVGKSGALWAEILGGIKGRVFLDLEPYVSFWGDDSDVSAVAKQLAGLDRGRLGVTFDPRRPLWAGLDAVMGQVSVACPQVYSRDWLSLAEALVGRWGVSWEPLVSVSENVEEWLGIVSSPRFRASGFGVWCLPVANGAQRELIGLARDPKASAPDAAGVDVEYRGWAPKFGTWREVADNLLGVANDALEAGRKVSQAAKEAGALWGTR